jgi:hypothetical protein
MRAVGDRNGELLRASAGFRQARAHHGQHSHCATSGIFMPKTARPRKDGQIAQQFARQFTSERYREQIKNLLQRLLK